MLKKKITGALDAVLKYLEREGSRKVQTHSRDDEEEENLYIYLCMRSLLHRLDNRNSVTILEGEAVPSVTRPYLQRGEQRVYQIFRSAEQTTEARRYITDTGGESRW